MDWDAAAAVIAVVGWFLSPVITLLLPKILSCLGFDASDKLLDLEIHIVPELNKTLRAVEQQSMAKEVDSDVVAALGKMASMLRHAQYEVQDIFDDAQLKIVVADVLYGAVKSSCIARCLAIAGIVRTGSSRLLQWARSSSLCAWFLRRRSEDALPVFLRQHPRLHIYLCSSFGFLKKYCRSIFCWLVGAIEVARSYRVWSYDVVGITSHQENANVLDFILTAISRRNLKKRIERVKSTINELNKSPLLGLASKSALNDIANKNRRQIRTASKQKVFGREVFRDDIIAKLRHSPPSSGTSPCYSVIGIYGVAGSGKTTFARYVRDYIEEECKEKKLFDTIMCIHVSETFSVDAIFHEMLKDITEDPHSNISDHEELENMLKDSLRGKRFFLILDDLWVKNKCDSQLQELISPLYVGNKGSKILVTARTKDATKALCADEPIKMPDLDDNQYLLMFMHYALGGTNVGNEELISVGGEIAKKLHQSPIAAAIVAGRLGTNLDISFWEYTAKLDMLDDKMDALRWSYQQLNPNIRRCLEYCNIFPRRSKLYRDTLVALWIAQGFVKTSCATIDIEDVAEGYIQELVSCAFLQQEQDLDGAYYFTIHDLLHDLVDRVAGSDCIRIENATSQRGEGWKGDVPRVIRHVFIQKYDRELITEKIIGLQNLRTLIIDFVGKDTPVEEHVIDSICKMLPKLRVLVLCFNENNSFVDQPNKFSFPESISHLKHLRYISFRMHIYSCELILPSAITRLQYIQLIDFSHAEILNFRSAGPIKLGRMFGNFLKIPNIGRLISLHTIPRFRVVNEQGYELMQLRDLNKLGGNLEISGLGNVKSKEEALEANLAAKERLRDLELMWCLDDTTCSLEVEAEVLEGLCPPAGLRRLKITGFKGSRYPDWMVGKKNGGPKDLRQLEFYYCKQMGPSPQLVEAFPRLSRLHLWECSWDVLPGEMEHLTSLRALEIFFCAGIRSLPTLPRSLEWFVLKYCDDDFMTSCQTFGHPNFQKIAHIPIRHIG